MKMFSFFITDENKKFLKELSQETKTNMSQIINYMINEASKKENFKNKNSDYISFSCKNDDDLLIDFRVLINEEILRRIKAFNIKNQFHVIMNIFLTSFTEILQIFFLQSVILFQSS